MWELRDRSLTAGRLSIALGGVCSGCRLEATPLAWSLSAVHGSTEWAGRSGWSEGYGNESYDSGLKTNRNVTGRLRARGSCAVRRESQGKMAGLRACEASLYKVREGAGCPGAEERRQDLAKLLSSQSH